METVVRRGGPGLLVRGSPFVLRSDYGLRAAMTPPLTEEDIRSLFDELRATPEEIAQRVGHRTVEVGFGETYRFQIIAIGELAPRALLFVETKATSMRPPRRRRSRTEQVWLNPTWRTSLDDFLSSTFRESVWAPGCPPLMRGDADFLATKCPPLSDADFAELVARLRRHSTPGESSEGFASMHLHHGVRHGDRFTVSVFGGPTPTLLIIMRWPEATPDPSAAP